MTNHVTLFFEPIDVLLFRDTRPLDAGVSIVAHSVFPGPGVFYGCIRAALLRHCGARGTPFETQDGAFVLDPDQDLAQVFLGSPSRLGSMTMRGPLLARWDDSARPLFPMPRDLVCAPKDKRDERSPFRAQILKPVEFGAVEDAPRRFRHGVKETKQVDDVLPFSTNKPEKSGPPRTLTEQGMHRYLDGDLDKDFKYGADFILQKDAFEEERRIGLSRSHDTHAAEEGMLYFTRPYRFTDGYGFAVDIEVDEKTRPLVKALDGRVVPLGGKGHRARVHVVDDSLIHDELDPLRQTNPLEKLVLLTPLPLPLGSNEHVRAMVTDRATPVGGYDLAKQAPKPLERALPTGTVVYTRGDTHKAYDSLFGQNDAVTGMNRRMGYGLALGGASRS